MTELNSVFDLVDEINRNWNRMIVDIRNGKPQPIESHTLKIVDRHDDTEFGTVVVDDLGTIRSISLDPYEVSSSNENQILSAIIATINTAFTKASDAWVEGKGW